MTPRDKILSAPGVVLLDSKILPRSCRVGRRADLLRVGPRRRPVYLLLFYVRGYVRQIEGYYTLREARHNFEHDCSAIPLPRALWDLLGKIA